MKNNVGYFSSYCKYVFYMLRLVYERFYLRYVLYNIPGLPKSKKNQESILQYKMQSKMEQNIKRILGRQKDTILQKTKQRYRGFKKSKVEGWTKSRQRRIYSYMAATAPKLGLSWLCQRTSLSSRRNNWQISQKRRNNTSYRWQQTKQLGKEFGGIC